MPTTPNMGLVLPVAGAGGTAGPVYANDLTNQSGGGGLSVTGALWQIDQHNHTPGGNNGVQVPTAGININADLIFNNFSATSMKAVAFTTQGSAPAGNARVYFIGRELWVTDNSGSQIQMTNLGSVAGTTGSISGLVAPASAAYNSISKTFVWQQNANQAANMDAGNLLIRDPTNTSVNPITIASPVGVASSYTLTLPPAVPASQALLSVSTTGVVTTKVAGQQISSSSAGFSTSSTTQVDVTNLTVTITTSGRPVLIMLQPDGQTNVAGEAYLSVSATAAHVEGYCFLQRAGTNIAVFLVAETWPSSGGNQTFTPPSSVMYLDAVAAGTYTYKFQTAVVAGTNTFTWANIKLVAWEI